MNNFIIKFKTSKTNVLFGNYLTLINKILLKQRKIIICDKTVYNLYPQISKLNDVICIDVNEKNKSLKTVEFLYGELNKRIVDKNTNIVAIGGGITCDIVGFVASTYYRGLPFMFIPTTFLAMIDASIGGKNGVNFNNHKNVIGTINQPQNIIIDKRFLNTLPKNEFINGIGELIKHSIISGNNFFNIVSNNNKLKRGVVDDKIIELAIKTKVKIVTKDEKENNLRKVLNLGHTIGHIIETNEKIKHGVAIAIGMYLSAKVSEKLKIGNVKTINKIYNTLCYYDIPTTCKTNIKKIIQQLDFDKKNENDYLHFVFIEDIGKVVVKKILKKKLGETLTQIELF